MLRTDIGPRGLAVARAQVARGLTADRTAVIALMVAIAMVWLPRLHGPIDLRSDAAVYYVLGTSIAEGKGYRLLNEPGEIEATQYPPLLPAVVALHQWLAGTSDHVIAGQALRRTFAMLFAGYILAAYAVARRRLLPGWAFLATFSVLAHPFTSWLSDTCYAEIPFAFATTMFVFFFDRRASSACAVLAGLCAVAAYLLRTIGITLLLAWIAEAAFRREWRRAAARLLVALLPVVAWHAYIARVERSPAYAAPAYPYQRAASMFYNVSYARNAALKAPFSPEEGVATPTDIAKRMLRNIRKVADSLGGAVTTMPGYWDWLVNQVAAFLLLGPVPPRVIQGGIVVLGTLVIAGLAILGRRGDLIVPLYLLAYIGAVTATPWPWPFWRYWAAAAPFVSIPFFVALMTLAERVRPWRAGIRQAVTTALAATVAVIVVAQVVVAARVLTVDRQRVEYTAASGERVVYRLFYYRASHRAVDAALDWLRDRAGVDDIVAGSVPQYIYLRTGRRAVMPPFEPDTARAASLLDAVPVSYVVIDGTGVDLAGRYIAPLLRGEPQKWTPVYSVPEGDLVIYARRT